jgi:hypothetical protein
MLGSFFFLVRPLDDDRPSPSKAPPATWQSERDIPEAAFAQVTYFLTSPNQSHTRR